MATKRPVKKTAKARDALGPLRDDIRATEDALQLKGVKWNLPARPIGLLDKAALEAYQGQLLDLCKLHGIERQYGVGVAIKG